MSKKIGIDLDEVLAELLHWCIDMHEGKLGHCDIAWHDIRNYNLDEQYPVERDVVVDFFYKPFSDAYLEELIQPVDGAFERLREFQKAGYTIYVITARQDKIQEHTLRFLDRHYAGLIHDVHFANHFSELSVPKHEICKNIGIQVMVEDNIDYALWIAESGICTYLLEKPWNAHRNEKHTNLIRVKNWSEIQLEYKIWL